MSIDRDGMRATYGSWMKPWNDRRNIATVPMTLDPVTRINSAENFFAATGSDLRHAGTAPTRRKQITSRCRPSRLSGTPRATTPRSPMKAPTGSATKAVSPRLRRQALRLGSLRDGGAGRRAGSAFLCAYLALSNEPREDHAAYLASWLKVLKGDAKAIFTAASHAQRAADYLNGLQP